MIRSSADSEIYLYQNAVDMRSGANGLVSIVEGEMDLDPFSSTLFIFCNHARSIPKLVCWDGNGFLL